MRETAKQKRIRDDGSKKTTTPPNKRPRRDETFYDCERNIVIIGNMATNFRCIDANSNGFTLMIEENVGGKSFACFEKSINLVRKSMTSLIHCEKSIHRPECYGFHYNQTISGIEFNWHTNENQIVMINVECTAMNFMQSWGECDHVSYDQFEKRFSKVSLISFPSPPEAEADTSPSQESTRFSLSSDAPEESFSFDHDTKPEIGNPNNDNESDYAEAPEVISVPLSSADDSNQTLITSFELDTSSYDPNIVLLERAETVDINSLHPIQWDVRAVSEFIAGIDPKFREYGYHTLFEQANIDGNRLLMMDNEGLKFLVPKVGVRAKILYAIDKLKTKKKKMKKVS